MPPEGLVMALPPLPRPPPGRRTKTHSKGRRLGMTTNVYISIPTRGPDGAGPAPASLSIRMDSPDEPFAKNPWKFLAFDV